MNGMERVISSKPCISTPCLLADHIRLHYTERYYSDKSHKRAYILPQQLSLQVSDGGTVISASKDLVREAVAVTPTVVHVDMEALDDVDLYVKLTDFPGQSVTLLPGAFEGQKALIDVGVGSNVQTIVGYGALQGGQRPARGVVATPSTMRVSSCSVNTDVLSATSDSGLLVIGTYHDIPSMWVFSQPQPYTEERV